MCKINLLPAGYGFGRQHRAVRGGLVARTRARVSVWVWAAVLVWISEQRYQEPGPRSKKINKFGFYFFVFRGSWIQLVSGLSTFPHAPSSPTFRARPFEAIKLYQYTSACGHTPQLEEA